MHAKSLQPCLTLCDLVDTGSSVHGILQARILEWIAISFSRGSSQPRDQTLVSCSGGHSLYHCATREAPTTTMTIYSFISGCTGSSLLLKLSLVAVSGLQAHGTQAKSCSEVCRIFSDQDLTCVPCIGRWILNHWTIREVL